MELKVGSREGGRKIMKRFFRDEVFKSSKRFTKISLCMFHGRV